MAASITRSYDDRVGIAKNSNSRVGVLQRIVSGVKRVEVADPLAIAERCDKNVECANDVDVRVTTGCGSTYSLIVFNSAASLAPATASCSSINPESRSVPAFLSAHVLLVNSIAAS